MPEYLVNLIVHVHANSVSEIVYGEHTSDVKMGQGLRQGCPIAPLVYAAWTSRLCKLLNERLGRNWSQSTLTIFADDKFLCWTIGSERDLEQAVREVGVVLATLRELGMKVSNSKSEAVLAVKGNEADAARKRFVVKWNGEMCLRVGKSTNTANIPIKSELAYLGVQLSYGSYELQSAKHRCKLAKVAFSRLHRVLRTGAVLSKAAKLRIYRACVWPVLAYGLPGLGLDARAMDSVCSTAAMHLRKILRLYQHGISNMSVFEQAGLNPEDELLKSVTAQLNKYDSGDGATSSQGRQEAQRIQTNLQEIIRSRGRGILPHTQTSEISCPVCGLYFGSEAGLAMHIKSKHKTTHEEAKLQYIKSQHSLFGIPMCKFCLKVHCDWQSLEKHITMGDCMEIKTAIAKGITMEQLLENTEKAQELCPPQPPEALRHRVEHKVLLAEDAAMFLAQNSELEGHTEQIRSLSTRCALCGQVVLSGTRVKPHWRKAHPAAWAWASQDAISECKSLSSMFRKPCQFCGSQAKNSMAHAGQCPALFQVLAGRCLRSRGLQEGAGADSKEPKKRSSERIAVSMCVKPRLRRPSGRVLEKGQRGCPTRRHRRRPMAVGRGIVSAGWKFEPCPSRRRQASSPLGKCLGELALQRQQTSCQRRTSAGHGLSV